MTEFNTIVARLKATPPILRGSLALSLLYILLVLGVFLVPLHFNWLLQYIGGGAIPLAMGSLVFCWMAIFTNQRSVIPRFSLLLVMLAAFGGFEVYLHYWGSLRDANRFGNPYLNYSDWQPVFTIGVPLLWAAALRARQVRGWIQEG